MKNKSIFCLLALCLWLPVNAQKDSTLYLSPQLPDNDQWWQLFGDSTLLYLIDQTITYNYDLQSAMRKIEIARTQMRIKRGNLFPHLTASVEYSPEKNSQGIDHETGYNRIGQAGISMNWEIDVFGNIRKNIEAQKQYYIAAQEDYRGVMVSLASEVAQAYIQLRSYQQQLQVTHSNVASQEEILRLNEIKAQAGLASQLAVAQSRSLWLETQATLPGIEAAIYEQSNALLTLVGHYSDSLRKQLLEPQDIPTIKQIPIQGIPAHLIRQRPDVLSAEKNIEALAAEVGASRADWWPKFYLNGTIGYGNKYFQQFFRKENLTWQIAPSIQWTIFNGRQVAENHRLARLELDEGIENYNQILLTALQEIDNALFAYNKSLQQLKAARQAFEQIRLTLQYAIDLYNRGLADYQSVLDSQRNVFNYENTLVNAENNTLILLIQLYKAIGGGFDFTPSLKTQK